MRGKFITFEGSEGCGKSTQSRLLYKYLKAKGKRVIYLREPGATKISEKIRDILLDAHNDGIVPEAEMLLYMAARAQIVAELIEPALKKGVMVICDRFLDSTLAYQGYALGVSIDLIRKVGAFTTRGITPDLTLFLDLAVQHGLKHRQANLDRIEMRSVNYHLRVRRGYLKLAQQEPKRIKVVKVEKDKYRTQGVIRKLVEQYVF
jgi:dTMP kinase